MKYSAVGALLCVFSCYGMDWENARAVSTNGIISGAVYFVIHTREKSTMYRAGNETIYSGPDFYPIRFPHHLSVAVRCQKVLPTTGPLVTFHDAETYFITAHRDDAPYKKLDLWRARLDPAAKVYVYRASMYLRDVMLKLYDKQDHPIAEMSVERDDKRELAAYKEIIDDYADSSKLNFIYYQREDGRTGIGYEVILSHEKVLFLTKKKTTISSNRKNR